jgi:hypothetical protein
MNATSLVTKDNRILIELCLTIEKKKYLIEVNTGLYPSKTSKVLDVASSITVIASFFYRSSYSHLSSFLQEVEQAVRE